MVEVEEPGAWNGILSLVRVTDEAFGDELLLRRHQLHLQVSPVPLQLQPAEAASVVLDKK